MACWSAWRKAARPLSRFMALAVGVLGWAFAGLALRGWAFYAYFTSCVATICLHVPREVW